MKYIVMEAQTNSDNVCSTIVTTYDSQNEAESKYHQVLSAAAISNVAKHGAFMLTDVGRCIKAEYFEHSTEE